MEQTNASLYDDKLVFISGSLVERYNQALDSLGIERTNLQSFSIDAYGWSPEIAKEKENNAYLAHGENIPYGIIISTEQSSCSLIYSYHTFDKKLLDAVYAKHGERINDMLLWTSIIMHIETGMRNIQSPVDLLKWKDVRITCSVPYFIKKAKEEQMKLVSLFYEGDNFMDDDVQNQLLQSSVKYGDLREKNFDFEEVTSTIGSFYTQAFGGIYVIRSGNNTMLVCNSTPTLKKCVAAAPDGVYVQHIDDEEVTKILKQWNVLSIVVNEERLRLLSNVKLGMVVAKQLPDDIRLEDVFNNGALKQKYYDANKEKLQLCVDLKKIRDNYQKVPPDALRSMLAENGIVELLYSPYNKNPAEDEVSALWQLLTDRRFENITMFYKHNRGYFEQLYNKWPSKFQEWVMSFVKK